MLSHSKLSQIQLASTAPISMLYGSVRCYFAIMIRVKSENLIIHLNLKERPRGYYISLIYDLEGEVHCVINAERIRGRQLAIVVPFSEIQYVVSMNLFIQCQYQISTHNFLHYCF